LYCNRSKRLISRILLEIKQGVDWFSSEVQFALENRERLFISYSGLLILLSHCRSGLAQEFFEWMLLTDLSKYIDVKYNTLLKIFIRNKIQLQPEIDYVQIVIKSSERLFISYIE